MFTYTTANAIKLMLTGLNMTNIEYDEDAAVITCDHVRSWTTIDFTITPGDQDDLVNVCYEKSTRCNRAPNQEIEFVTRIDNLAYELCNVLEQNA